MILSSRGKLLYMSNGPASVDVTVGIGVSENLITPSFPYLPGCGSNYRFFK